MSDHDEETDTTEGASNPSLEDAKQQAARQIDDQIASNRESGKAWQESDLQRAKEFVGSDDPRSGLRDIAASAMTEALTGQDAERLLGEPAFEAASDSILDQPLLMIWQEAKVVSVSDEYHYGRPDGEVLATGSQINQGLGRKALRFVSKLDDKMKTVIEVTQDGERLFEMERTGKLGKNTMHIRGADGADLGTIVQTKFADYKGEFEIRAADGEVLSAFKARRIRTSGGFDITTPDGELLAWVRRLHEGAFKNIGQTFTSRPDHYVLRLERPLEDPLRTLVIATPMAVDSAVGQRDDGMDFKDIRRAIRRFT